MTMISQLIAAFEEPKPLKSLADRDTLIIINDVLAILGAAILLIRTIIILSSDLSIISEKSSQ
ncbi:MAG TPA: hypothetical protein GX519_01315 [Thermoanaerobacterales bacterium]|nr:hypothetical protein [Thermoanaerobacterales bacterium]